MIPSKGALKAKVRFLGIVPMILLALAMQLSLRSELIDIHPPFAFNPGAVTTVELDPVKPNVNWNQAIVSWNVKHARGGELSVEARVAYPGRTTKYYRLGVWSLDSSRHSVEDQKDDDGNVSTDTLMVNQPGGSLQLRLTGKATDTETRLSLLKVVFTDTRAAYAPDDPGSRAWGKILPVPAKVQHDYPHGGVLCSPTSLSMLLEYWSPRFPWVVKTVPEIRDGVYDSVYKGAGNWPFNTAFAGSFESLEAFVNRFEGMSELEESILVGEPVACSVSLQLLHGKQLDVKTEQGHLVVLVGFTKAGDPVLNDPNERKNPVTYKRADFISAWSYSNRTVYQVRPIHP
jgi:uncharacterized protein YvpB